MTTYFEIFIPGNVIPQKPGRIVKKGKFVGIADRQDVADYKSYIKTYIANKRPVKPTNKALKIEIDFYFLKPKSWSKKKKYYDVKPDWDNLSKLIADCLQGIVYTNDSRIIEASIKKQLSDAPGVNIKVFEMEE